MTETTHIQATPMFTPIVMRCHGPRAPSAASDVYKRQILDFLDKVDSKSYVSLVSKMRILRILESTAFIEAHTPREPVARLVE